MTRDLVFAAWALVALLVVGVEVVARLSGGRVGTFDALAERLGRSPVAFVALFVGWMWLGWHLFAR